MILFENARPFRVALSFRVLFAFRIVYPFPPWRVIRCLGALLYILSHHHFIDRR